MGQDNSGTEYYDINIWCTKTMCLVQVLSKAVFHCIYSALKNKTSLSAWLKKKIGLLDYHLTNIIDGTIFPKSKSQWMKF